MPPRRLRIFAVKNLRPRCGKAGISKFMCSKRGVADSGEVDLRLIYLEPNATPDMYRKIVTNLFVNI
jgi:hypothetical protein